MPESGWGAIALLLLYQVPAWIISSEMGFGPGFDKGVLLAVLAIYAVMGAIS